MLVIVFILLFLGLGAAWWIGEKLDNMKAGFFIVGGVYGSRIDHHFGNGKKGFNPGDPEPDYKKDI